MRFHRFLKWYNSRLNLCYHIYMARIGSAPDKSIFPPFMLSLLVIKKVGKVEKSMNDLQIENICGVDCYERDGTAYLNLEAVARGLGFVQMKNGVEYVRWETVGKYLGELHFPNKLGKDDFIPENIFYRLAMKAKNEMAEKFQALVADEIIPSIRKHGMYATDQVIDRILENPDFGIELLTKLKEERAEKERLQRELDQSKDWYSIKRVAALNGVSWKTFDWRRLKETGAQMGYGVKKIFDANYGTINAYHKDVWEAAYPRYEL